MRTTSTTGGATPGFIEMGKSAATRVEGNFFARPEPEVRVHEVSEVHAAEKRRFEKERLERWFGS